MSNLPSMSENLPHMASDLSTKPNNLSSNTADLGTLQQKKSTESTSLAYFERISGLTGMQMQGLLARMGVKMSRLSLDMNYNENYLVSTLRLAYAHKPLPWRIVSAIRAKVGESIFDTAFAEVYDGVSDHALNVTGQQLRQIVREAGLNMTVLAKKVGRSRNSLQSMIIRHYMVALPIAFVALIRNAMGEVDYDLMFRRVMNHQKGGPK